MTVPLRTQHRIRAGLHTQLGGPPREPTIRPPLDRPQPTPKPVDSPQRPHHLPAGVDIEIRLAT